MDTYRFVYGDFIDGNLNGHKAKPLTAKEILDIGKTVAGAREKYKYSEYKAIFRWTHLARLKLQDEDNKTVEEYYIHELEVNTYTKVGCLCSSEVEKLLEHSSFSRDIQVSRDARCKDAQFSRCKPRLKREYDIKVTQNFQELCRGDATDADVGNATIKPLLCHLIDNGDPRLILQPVKLEEMRTIKPYIATLHDILRDREISYFKENAMPKLARGKTLSTSGLKTAENKVSQQVFIPIKHYKKPILNLRNRLAAATKLNVEGFEKIQVANYAAGGFYDSHLDANFLLSAKPETYLGKDNRVISIVMYLSDVEEGGATAFPYVGVAVKPKKGNAVLFYNLHRNLKMNRDSQHGGCPILTGEKWIATQWVRTFHQEFHHQCALDSME